MNKKNNYGEVYVVGLSIGNIEDIGERAIKTLKTVDRIFCEDTREFYKIAKIFNINVPVESFHNYNEKDKATKIINLIEKGHSVAITSDRGTPNISDPGKEFLKMFYDKFNESNSLRIIPGCSALSAAISVNPFSSTVTFCGFFSKKIIEQYKNSKAALVFFEAPHRINSTLQNLYQEVGNRRVLILKEIGKTYEKITLKPLRDLVLENPKGEFVIILEECQEKTSMDIKKLSTIKALNLSVKTTELAKILHLCTDIPKSQIYNFLMDKHID